MFYIVKVNPDDLEKVKDFIYHMKFTFLGEVDGEHICISHFEYPHPLNAEEVGCDGYSKDFLDFLFNLGCILHIYKDTTGFRVAIYVKNKGYPGYLDYPANSKKGKQLLNSVQQ